MMRKYLYRHNQMQNKNKERKKEITYIEISYIE